MEQSFTENPFGKCSKSTFRDIDFNDSSVSMPYFVPNRVKRRGKTWEPSFKMASAISFGWSVHLENRLPFLTVTLTGISQQAPIHRGLSIYPSYIDSWNRQAISSPREAEDSFLSQETLAWSF